jgi:hypothetical protein
MDLVLNRWGYLLVKVVKHWWLQTMCAAMAELATCLTHEKGELKIPLFE